MLWERGLRLLCRNNIDEQIITLKTHMGGIRSQDDAAVIGNEFMYTIVVHPEQ